MALDSSGHLLLVDDDVDLLTVLPIALNHLGAEITAVRSGELALAEVNDHDFAAVILDVDLGHTSGFEIARRIRSNERSKHTPIMFVTGASCDGPSSKLGYRSGGVDYLFKPVDLEVLTAKLRVFLDLDRESRRVSARNEALIQEVADAAKVVHEAKILRGLLAICAYCHRIRDDEQNWQALEAYITRHSEARFSHGICPACFDVHLRDELDNLPKNGVADGPDHTSTG